MSEESSTSDASGVIRLSNAYSAFIPLWDDYGMIESETKLPEDLRTQLYAWSDTFDDLYDPDNGWPNLEICKREYLEGLALKDALQAFYGPEVTVEFKFWERNVQGTIRDLSEIDK